MAACPAGYPHLPGGRGDFSSWSYKTKLGEARLDDKGRLVARDARSFPDYLKRRRELGASELYVCYPDLVEGDVAAVFGQVYRVKDIFPGKIPHMTMEKLPKQKVASGGVGPG